MHERTGKTALARREGGALPEQILDTPGITDLVPRLPPETLHAAIAQSGLEACGPLLALATPAQLARVLDLDLWRGPASGDDEQFDAERFGTWLEVLVEQGVEVAAVLLAQLDPDLVAAGLAQHVRIFDIATLEAYQTSDGSEIPAVIERDGGLGCDLAGRRLIPRRTDAWDAITAVLAELAASHVEAFVRLMRRCSALSNSRREVDGLDDLLTDAGQAMFDLADARRQRREALGFATPASARAFLEASRRVRLDPLPAGAGPVVGRASTAMVADQGHATRQQELAWLVNVLIAGCSIDARPFTPQEAADAVVATCRLGIESGPGLRRHAGPLPDDDFLAGTTSSRRSRSAGPCCTTRCARGPPAASWRRWPACRAATPKPRPGSTTCGPRCGATFGPARRGAPATPWTSSPASTCRRGRRSSR